MAVAHLPTIIGRGSEASSQVEWTSRLNLPLPRNVPCYDRRVQAAGRADGAHELNEARGLREAQRQELSRYRADYLAARAPLPVSLVSGAVAGLAVYFVPLGIVFGSFLLLRLVDAVAVPPAALIVRLFRRGAAQPGRAVPPDGGLPALGAPDTAARAPGVEALIDDPGQSWLVAAAMVLLWPLAMMAIGALVAWVYRARRTRRAEALKQTPLDLSILVEVAFFYALTAAAGLLAGVGSFVALAANVVFSWAGYLIWRRLHDVLLHRLAPRSVRVEAARRIDDEATYRRMLREGR